MSIVHNNRKRKPTGGRYKDVYPKRLAQHGDLPTHTRIGEKRVKHKRSLGGNAKRALLAGNKVNLTNSKTNNTVVAKVESVSDNQASRHFVRRNIITKGAVIQTDKGKAKVTNRPGQDDVINAVLVE